MKVFSSEISNRLPPFLLCSNRKKRKVEKNLHTTIIARNFIEKIKKLVYFILLAMDSTMIVVVYNYDKFWTQTKSYI
jgi:hypothetical protein